MTKAIKTKRIEREPSDQVRLPLVLPTDLGPLMEIILDFNLTVRLWGSSSVGRSVCKRLRFSSCRLTLLACCNSLARS